MKIPIASINRELQTRAAMNADTAAEYAEAMQAGAEFPPVIVFSSKDGIPYLADGFHRLLACEEIGETEIEADVRQGSRKDALMFALGANRTHGLKRTNEDKRNCVKIALTAFGEYSDRSLADLCGVSDMFIASQRKVQTVCTSTAKRTGKDGKSYPVKPVKAEKPSKPAPKTQFPPDEDFPPDDDRPCMEDNDESATPMQGDTPGLERLKSVWTDATIAEQGHFIIWLKKGGVI